MNLKDYISPFIAGVVFLISSIIFSNIINKTLIINNYSSEIFTVVSLMFGLILTAYSLLFGILPVMKSDMRTSNTIKDINNYFRSCLLILLFHVVVSLLYMFLSKYWLFMFNITLLGIDIGFFGYIIFLINDIFEEIKT